MTEELRPAFAIVGIGCRFPGGGNTPARFWQLLRDGVDAVTEFPADRFDLNEVFDPDPAAPGKMYTRWGGFTDDVKGFDAGFFGVSPREALRIDPQHRVLLEIVWEALEDGGLPADRLIGSKTGVFIGISTHDYSDLQVGYRSQLDSYYGTGTALSIAANRISYLYDFRGPSFIVDTACSSSLTAVHLACRSLKSGECDLAIAGGVNLLVTPEPFIAFCKASMLSPDGRCKAFDAQGNGFVRGEGAGVVVLKSLERALADGDRIHAIVRGSAVNQDGRTTGITVPNAEAQEELIRLALADAGVGPQQVHYVEAHGTGTRVGDPIEAGAIGRVLSSTGRSTSCLLGSVKTNIGHLEAAAGIAGLVKTALSLANRTIPPSLHFHVPNPAISFDDLQLRVVTALEAWPTDGSRALAGVNSFGFGGANAHVVLEGPPAEGPPSDGTERSTYILPMSARHPQALRDACTSHRELLAGGPASLTDVCYTAAVRRGHHPYRACVVGSSAGELVEGIDLLLGAEQPGAAAAAGRPRRDEPKLAFIFSGMGPQWWGMGRQLFRSNALFRTAIEECDAAFERIGSWGLAAALAADEAESRVHEADLAPVANFAIQRGLVRVWASWGIVPDAIVGHSAGEIGAAFAAGALSLHDALRVGFHRGRLQHRASGTGTMLSVGLAADEAAEAIAPVADRVSIAAINSPGSVTLAGDRTVLEEIAADLARRGRFNRFLSVQVPYHGPQMQAIREEMLESLSGLTPHVPSIPLLSTVTGTWVDSMPLDPDYWYRNVRQPVRFASAIEALIARDFEIFVEVGPHPVLSQAMHETLSAAGQRGTVLPTLRRMEDEDRVMQRSLAALYTGGRAVNWSGVYPAGRVVSLPTYPWQRERHWFDPVETGSRARAGRDTGHPLLGYRLRSVNPVWEADLGDPRLQYLGEHVVQNSPTLPGAAYAEMAFAAGGELAPGAATLVEDLTFRKALFLANQKNTLVQFSVDPAKAAFEIHSAAADSDGGWTLHATGRIGSKPLDGLEGSALDLAAICARCTTEVPPAQVYASLDARGLRYGRDFLGIDALWLGDREAAVRIKLPSDAQSDASSYRIHPALLDAAFQSILAVTEASGAAEISARSRYLPASIKRLTFVRAPGPIFWSHATVTAIDAEAIEGDVVITDEHGRIAVRVEGLRCKSLHDASRDRQDGTDALYQLAWELAPAGVRRALEPSPVQAAGELATGLAAAATELADDLAWVAPYARLEPVLDAIVVRYTRAALLAMGWSGDTGAGRADALASDLGVADRHRRLFDRLLEVLRENPLPPASPATPAGERAEAERLCARVLLEFPQNRAAVDLLGRSGERLAQVLKDEADAREVLFAPAAASAWARFFGEVPWYQYYNALVAEAVSRAVDGLPMDAPLRILEIGAGTGGTTASVLPRLAGRAVEYHFSDVSTLFLAQARERFRDQPQVKVLTLDIESDPSPQVGTASYDIVVAANVLHATADLRTTVDHVKQLLRPGGLLVLLEVSRKMAWTDLIFGITDGWWRFADLDIRPSYALMSADRWGSVLTGAGFEAPSAVSEPAADAGPVSAVILATRSIETASAAGTGSTAKDWLLFPDSAGVGEGVAAVLRARGDRVVSVTCGATPLTRTAPDGFVISSTVDDVTTLLDTLGNEGFRADGVIHLRSLDAMEPEALTASHLVSLHQASCEEIVALVQAFDKAGGTPPFWVATSRAQSVEAGEAPQLTQAPIWGLIRVLASEQPRGHARLLDLDLRPGADPVAALLDELGEESTLDFEEEVAYRGARRYVTRLRATRVGDAAALRPKRPTSPDEHQFRLEIDTPGALESLTLREAPRGTPGPGEIEIRVLAAGLNFRDVMLALGLLPPMVLPGSAGKTGLGFECAGVITACGEGVDEYRPGDEVIALAFGAFASHVITRAVMAAPKPASLSFETAATIPLVFASAQYGLLDLARLAPGERVLIHAATGGVGLAAVQIARRAGAQIYATAGTDEKRAHLTALGIEHVYDSRSLAFADQILLDTGGEGVDVVLNSLAGEAIRKGLSILRPYGRFIELGKRDIHADTAVGLQPFDRSLVFCAVALERMFFDRSAVLGRILRDIMAAMDRGTLTPIPFTAFDVGEAESAFRTLGQARHIGKLVLSLRAPAYAVAADDARRLCRDGATYLITGGLGGFGLATARWLVENGATHIVLASRTGVATPENEDALAALHSLPATIVVLRADVSRESDVRAALDEIRRTMPPLAGVIHAAMVLDDVPLAQLTPARLGSVLEPKIAGAWNLHLLTAPDDLDFFVMFSSFASIIGTKGQGNYAAANAFLDMLAPYRRALGLPALTINWGGLTDVGYVAQHQEVAQYLHRHGTEAFTSAEALNVLGEALRLGVTQLMAARLDWARWSAIEAKAFRKSKRLAHFASEDPDAAREGASDRSVTPVLASAAPADRQCLLEGYIAERVAKVLGTSAARVAPEVPLTQMGVDSLMAVELQTIVERDLGVPVPLDWLLEGIAIRQLASRVLDRLALEAPAGVEEPAPGPAAPSVPLSNADAGAASASAATSPAAAPSAETPSPSLRPEPSREAAAPPAVATAARAPADPHDVPRKTTGPAAAAPPMAPAPAARTSLDSDRRRVDYRALDYRRWTPGQRASQQVVRALFRVAASVEIVGLEHVPVTGPVVMAANHLSMLDVPLIFTMLPRRTVCLAADRLRDSRLIRSFLDIGDTIYVHRGEADQEALASALDVLRSGGVLGIAPEGTRSPTGGLTRGRSGAAHLSAQAQAPILPVVAFGHEQIRENLRRGRRTRVSIHIGPVIPAPPITTSSAQLQAFTEHLMRTLASMLPPAYRGIYSDVGHEQMETETVA